MKIRNDGKATVIFNGGKLEAGKVASFKGEAEKIGKILLERYKFLIDLDDVKEVEVVEVTLPEKSEEPKAKKTKKGKKK